MTRSKDLSFLDLMVEKKILDFLFLYIYLRKILSKKDHSYYLNHFFMILFPSSASKQREKPKIHLPSLLPKLIKICIAVEC